MISCIVPVYNGSAYLSRCLRAIVKSEYANYECIVVDDGSTDDSRSIAEAFGATVLPIPAGPRGPAYARNAGAQIATGDILFFVDADVLIRPDTLHRLAQTFESDPSVAAIFGSYDQDPHAPNFVSQYKNLFHHFVHQHAHTEATTFWSGCGAIRRAVFQGAGGFDATRYPRPSIEDIELGGRLKAAGHRIRLDKALQVKHLKRWTLSGLIRCDVFDRAAPWTKLLFERRDMPNDLNLRTSQRISTLLVCGMLALTIVLAPFFPLLAILPVLGGVFLALVGCLKSYDMVGTGRSGQPLLGVTVIGFAAAAAAVLLRLPAWLAILVVGGLGAILLLNRQFYAFFWRLRGPLFAAAVVPFHLLYYLYSVLGLIIGILSAYVARRRRTVAERTTPPLMPG